MSPLDGVVELSGAMPAKHDRNCARHVDACVRAATEQSWVNEGWTLATMQTPMAAALGQKAGMEESHVSAKRRPDLASIS